MNADRLLGHYERIADAPDAVPRLRRFILDLAVRGKLVEQNQNDEPASELLGVISSTREEMVKASKAKRPKRLLPIADEDVLYDVPKSWSWAQANDLWDFENGDRGKNYPSRDQLVQRGIPFVNAGHLVNGRVSMFQMNFITPEKYQQLGGGKLKKGDQLYCLRGSLGKHAIYDHEGEGAIASSLVILRPIEQQCVPYLSIYLESNIAGQMLRRFDNGSAQPNLSSANLRKYEIPLPPLAEQHRIVAKVDELMALCDRLEAARTEREATRDRMAAASLVRLNDPDPDPVVFRNHAAFALENLAPLTTRTNQIKSLRQTILNLAVRGKLVEQDPNDEPASELLKRIAVEKVERKRKTGDARVKMGFDPKPDDVPMVFPPGWAAQSFENLFLFIDYRGKTPPKTNQGIPLITAKNIRMGYLNREPREYISEKTFKTWMTRGFPKIEDLFFTTEAPLANICLNEMDQPFALAQRVICFQPYGKINTKFLMFALMSAVMQSLIDTHATGMTAKGIKAANLKPLPIPIPPLAEQHRIVAKVDELMVFCNRLEKKLAAGDDTRRRLLDALLHEVLVMGADRKSVA